MECLEFDSSEKKSARYWPRVGIGIRTFGVFDDVQRHICKHNVLFRSIWKGDSTESFAFLARSHS